MSEGATPCPRAAEATRDHTLAALLDDAEHLERCAECRAALAGLQRLTGALVEISGSARRRPDHVARVLAASATGERAAPIIPMHRSWRRRVAAVAAPMIALAAGLVAVWWLRRDPERPTAPRFAFEIAAQHGAVLRGDASLGDLLRVSARTGAALWVYRNDVELLLVCPRDCRRDGEALLGELPLDVIGRYQIVWLSTDHVPQPSGDLQRDIAAARAAGATHELRDLEVQ